MTTPGSQSSEAVAFLQKRVAQFGLMGAGLGGTFLVFRAVLALAIGQYGDFTEPSFVLHGVAIAFTLLVWFLCRGGPRSRRFVERAEVACLLGSVFCYEAMGALIELDARPDLIVVLALTLVMMARAVYVPSTARRSLVLGVVAGIPLVIGIFLAYRAAAPPGQWSPTVQGLAVAASTGTWWSMTVVLTAATSRVIYGLRRQAREARQLGQYTLEEKIGEGGMGVVYRARHAMLRRPTAVKLLLPERTSAVQLARFEREVQLTARLTHPNTITIFDYGRTPDGVFYYAMELLHGATLETIVELDGPQPSERVAHVLEQVAGALTEAHGIGLIHRDIKPENIIVCDQGGAPDVAKVLDFGLVKDVGEAETVAASLATGEHVIAGTPLYLPPEAIVEPDSVDGRSDLYSLGAVGYYLLTGQHVFTGKSVVEICSHHLHTKPIAPAQRLGASVSVPLSELVLRCLEKDPQKRPQSAAELLEELGALDLVWDAQRARGWWKAHEGELAALRSQQSTSVPMRTIAVDLAGRFDRLANYLAERQPK